MSDTKTVRKRNVRSGLFRTLCVLSEVKEVVLLQSDRGGMFGPRKELVRYPDAAVQDDRRGWVQVGSALLEAAAQEGVREVCVCCGTWWDVHAASALSFGSAWRAVFDPKEHPQVLERWHLAGGLGWGWRCSECGAVFQQVGELHVKGWPLSLLPSLRFVGNEEVDAGGRGGVEGVSL